MVSSTALLSPESTVTTADDALIVAWQDPESRRYHAVGLLLRTNDDLYRFRYRKEASSVPGFRPFLGFSDLDRDYTSSHLFPLFAERILDDARPDRISLYDALDLVSTAGPMEFLARSGGRRAGDRIQLLPTPSVVDGHTSCVFLVHGVRYQEGAADAIDQLRPGDELALEPEPNNPIDPNAVLVTQDGTRLGWVPNPLLSYVRAVMSSPDARLTVVRANPRELGHHMRLLVRIEGTLPEDFVASW
jgi:hypothetical protein